MKDKNEKSDTVKGYLKKIKTSSIARMFGSSNLRWFEMNLQLMTFGYKENSQEKTFLEKVAFKHIVDYNENIPEDEKQLCDWKFGFKVVLKNKTFTLFAQTNQDREIWKKGFDIVLNRVVVQIPPPKVEKKPSPPKIDYEELERKRKQEEEEEEIRKKKLKEEQEKKERLDREKEREKNMKKNIFDDLDHTVGNFQNNMENYVEELKVIPKVKEKPVPKGSNKVVYQINEEVDDWNYYGNDGNLIDDNNKVVNRPMMLGELTKGPYRPNPLKKIDDFQNFKKNLLMEDLIDDNPRREIIRKEEERKRKEEEKRRLEEELRKKRDQEEKERRERELQLKKMKEQEEEKEREKEYKYSQLKGREKLKYELQEKNNFKEKYFPVLDLEKGTKYNIYNDSPVKKAVNIQIEGVDLTKRADQKFLNNDLLQPFNVTGDQLGFQRVNHKLNQTINNLNETKLKRNSIDASNININVSNNDLNMKLEDKNNIIYLNENNKGNLVNESTHLKKNNFNISNQNILNIDENKQDESRGNILNLVAEIENDALPPQEPKIKPTVVASTFYDIMDDLKEFDHNTFNKNASDNNKKSKVVNRETLRKQLIDVKKNNNNNNQVISTEELTRILSEANKKNNAEQDKISINNNRNILDKSNVLTNSKTIKNNTPNGNGNIKANQPFDLNENVIKTNPKDGPLKEERLLSQRVPTKVNEESKRKKGEIENKNEVSILKTDKNNENRKPTQINVEEENEENEKIVNKKNLLQILKVKKDS